VGDRPLQIWCSTLEDGNFHRSDVPFGDLDRRRRAVVDLPWTMPDHRHGADVVTVRSPGDGDGHPGDIAFGSLNDAVLACWVADCAPVVLIGADSEFAVVHAGWRGLADGVIDAAVDAFSEPVVDAVLGPCIHPCCYEFGRADLAAVASGVHATGADVSGVTAGGALALDVPAAVRKACHHHDVGVSQLGGCTGCSYDGFSHRVRRDAGRHVMAAWRTSEAST